MSEASACAPAHERRRKRLPFHPTSVLLLFSLLHCEHLIGIDQRDFGNGGAGTAGLAGAAFDGGEAGNDYGGAGGSGGDGRGGESAGKSGQPAGGGADGRGESGRNGAAGDDSELGGRPSVDAISPEVVAFSPDVESAGVAIDEPIRIEFSEAMSPDSVVTAYSQVPGRPWRWDWTDGNTVLTVSPGLELSPSSWTDGDRPGEPSDLVVTVQLDGRAHDEANNPLASPFSASYTLKRRVAHQLSPCLDLSGTVSAGAFEPVAPAANTPCVVDSDGPVVLKVGDSGDDSVAAVLTYSLRALPLELEPVSAVLALSFDTAVGKPEGTLLLEEIALGTELADAFAAPALSPLGVLSEGMVRDARKDVEAAVARVLDVARSDAFVQFRVRFEAPVADPNLSPDYVQLGGYLTPVPTLLLEYDCTRCP
jgi:hypothetical protein